MPFVQIMHEGHFYILFPSIFAGFMFNPFFFCYFNKYLIDIFQNAKYNIYYHSLFRIIETEIRKKPNLTSSVTSQWFSFPSSLHLSDILDLLTLTSVHR